MNNYLKLLMLPVAILAINTSTASANLISQFETQFDTDWTSAGVGGFRGTGAGSISLSGVNGTVNQAYLYWHGPTNSIDPTHNANINFADSAISGTNIGFSDDNLWSRDNSQAYRSDVTSLVTGNGNYNLSNLIPNDSNGASLVVFFDDGDNTNNRDVVLYEGNDSNFSNTFDPDGWNITLNGINYTSGVASLLFGVSDGQTFTDAALLLLRTTIAAAGPVFDGTTVPTTTGTTVSNGALWDLKTFDVTSFLSPGLNSLNVTHGAIIDALSAVHFAVNLPAGAAPNQLDQPNFVPEPATLALMGLGLAGLGFRRKRKST